jgi:hypothetical protein
VGLRLPGIVGASWREAGLVQARKHGKADDFLSRYEAHVALGESDGCAAFEACRELGLLEIDPGPKPPV